MTITNIILLFSLQRVLNIYTYGPMGLWAYLGIGHSGTPEHNSGHCNSTQHVVPVENSSLFNLYYAFTHTVREQKKHCLTKIKN